MDFDKANFEATTEIMSLATICEQTPMGEKNNGAFVFAYSKEEGSSALPGENNVGFTIINVENGLKGDFATNAMVSKILTSGQIYNRDGQPNIAFAEFIDNGAGANGCLNSLRLINAKNPQVGLTQVRDFNNALISTFAKSDKWARSFIERTEIIKNLSKDSTNNYVNATAQKLNAYVELARDVCKKNSINQFKDYSQSR